jgi:arylsulfatase A-like enzyme
MGDHGLMLKGPIHLQSLIRVPFIWADPAAPGPRVTDALSGTLDIAATVLDRARIEPYNGIQGKSLMPIVHGEANRTHDAVLIEEDGQRLYMGFDGPIRCRTLVTGRWRTTIYHGAEWGELYDLADDPHELRNLWNDPAHAGVRGELMELMARKQMALVDRSPLPTALA